MGIYKPEPKNYEPVAANSTALVDSVLENTPEEDKIKYINCIQCGELMKDNDKFCPNCGHDKSLPLEEPIIDEEKTEHEAKVSRNSLIVSVICFFLTVSCTILTYLEMAYPKIEEIFSIFPYMISSVSFVLFIVFLINGIVHNNKTIYKNRPYKIKGKNAGVVVGTGLTLYGVITSLITTIMFVGMLIALLTSCACW